LPDVICNTSPLQYLHQIRHLHILPALTSRIIVPSAVVEELRAGERLGVDLPRVEVLPWITMQSPVSAPALPLIADLGAGEAEVLMLALERVDAIVILDDALARQAATLCNLRRTGTLGLLLDAKHAGLVERTEPLLDDLRQHGFHLANHTREAVLMQAGEL
jgi:uncharacterized protein